MFKFKLYEQGSLYGLFYTFPKRGDGIGMHSHEPSQEHNIIVLRGLVEVYGPGRAGAAVLGPGSVYTPPLPHEIVALRNDSAILALHIHGKPKGEYLSAAEREGEMHSKPVTLALLESGPL